MKLALIPLPKSAIGSAAQPFALAYDSGDISNACRGQSHRRDAGTFKKLGRVSGYALEYGNAFTGAAGVTDVRTSIEQYKTAADARRALAFWKKEDAKLSKLDNPGFTVTSVPVKVPAPAAGTSHFAYLTSYSASNIVPVSGVDEQIADGRYVLDVIVTAGTASARRGAGAEARGEARRPAPARAQGRLHAKAREAAEAEGRAPPGGPDLSVLALRKSDLVGKATREQGIPRRPGGDLGLQRVHAPGGPFDVLDQEIEWYPAANEASFLRRLRERRRARAERDHRARPEQPRRRGAGERHRAARP